MVRVFAISFLLAACAGPSAPRAAIRVHPPQTYFVGEPGPTQTRLQLAVDSAIGGVDQELAFVISLARVPDGEAALNFGALLLQIEQAVGRSRFRRVLATLPQETRELAFGQMTAARRIRDFVARKRPNQAMQLTASKPDVYAFRVCHRNRMLRGMRIGLAAADLVSR